jgi:hypothetical protein
VDPRIVEREARGPGDLSLAHDEERERKQRGGDYEEVIAPPPDERRVTLTAVWHAPRRRRGAEAARE